MSVRRVWVLGVGLGLVPACAVEVESFVKSAASVSCRRTRECNRAHFDREYGGDLGSCKDAVREELRELADNAADADCAYVPKEGRACLRSGRRNKSNCDLDADREVTNDCALVFDCGENSRIEITL